MSDPETLFEFPCDFPIKAKGRVDTDVENVVFKIISKHVPGLQQHMLRTRSSRSGRFVSVTVAIVAQSREQLDAIYMELSGHPDVLYAL